LDEFQRFAQERLLEALVERRRALVAHPVDVRDVDAVQPWVLAHCEATLRAEDLGRAFVTVRHRARGVETGKLATLELAGGYAVVDVAKFPQPIVDRNRARCEYAERLRPAQEPAREVDVVDAAV